MLALGSLFTSPVLPGESTKLLSALQLLFTPAGNLQQSRCGLVTLTYVNIHGIGPVLSMAIGGAAEVCARVADLCIGDLDRSKVKSHYLW